MSLDPRTEFVYSFNPCCIGLFIKGSKLDAIIVSDAGFNPCCIGLFIKGLFSFIYVFFSFCFNPCCIGLFIKGRHSLQFIDIQRYRDFFKLFKSISLTSFL